MQSSRLEISRAALLHNYEVLRSAAGIPVLPVVKANGYGLGLRSVLTVLRDVRPAPQCLCVATVAEVYALRQLGWPGGILMLGAQHAADVREAIALGARPWIMSLAGLQQVLRQHPTHIDLDLDFGMGRMGIRPDDPDLHSLLHSYHGTLGIGTHHPNADREDLMHARALSQAWQQFSLQTAATVTERHSANTAATLNYLVAPTDTHTRCGIGLYGVDPRAEGAAAGLRPVFQLHGRIAEYRTVRRGEGLSYGHEFIAPRSMQVAVVTAGYADGIPIAGASRLPVYIGGVATRIVGRVTMDTVLVDATDLAEGQRREWVTLIGGPDSGAREWAAASGRSPYEILTGLGSRPATMVVP